MKLYYTPGACSLSPHIVLREGAFKFDIEKVDLQSKRTENGADFRGVNPYGYIPALILDNGERLSEGVAIVLYLADQVPDKKLAPPPASRERYRIIEVLTFIATELHKGFAPLFNPRCPDEWRAVVKEILIARLTQLAGDLGDKPYLVGNEFTVADAYLFTVLSWCGHVGVDLGLWPTLQSYAAHIGARPAVQAALKAEGLA
ncbi:glutathione transferase GstA [Nevskia soli]|uniref:glutathione transferase GstA n=1 Tax=Nevskia soli TaxID=418856 RepID=UPI0004A6B1D8|nr:glutathione transferase GstA [Nevskia soli]